METQRLLEAYKQASVEWTYVDGEWEQRSRKVNAAYCALTNHLVEAVRNAQAAGRMGCEPATLAIALVSPSRWNYIARLDDGTYALAKEIDNQGCILRWAAVRAACDEPCGRGVVTIDSASRIVCASTVRGKRAQIFSIAFRDNVALCLLMQYVIADAALPILARVLPATDLPEVVTSYIVGLHWLRKRQ